MTPRPERDRLHDILSHIDLSREAERFLLDSEAQAAFPRIAYAALMYCLIVIGEAVNQLDADTKARHAEMPWRGIIGMRNALAHEYFRIDADLVRSTLDAPMAQLETACLQLLEDPDLSGA